MRRDVLVRLHELTWQYRQTDSHLEPGFVRLLLSVLDNRVFDANTLLNEVAYRMD